MDLWHRCACSLRRKRTKARCTPFCRDVVAILEAFGCRDSQTHPLTPSFRALGVDASVPMPCQRLVARHTATACQVCASLSAKTVTPHSLRHAAAMALLRRGVDLTVIALWLGPRINGADRGVLACGHAAQRARAHATASGLVPDRYRAPDPLLAFLDALSFFVAGLGIAELVADCAAWLASPRAGLLEETTATSSHSRVLRRGVRG